MASCNLEWIGIYQWWCQMDPSGQAAWVQGLASILALVVAISIPQIQKKLDRTERESNDRKIVMSAAANLDNALSYQGALFEFMPAGDGVIGHDELTLDQARRMMLLQPPTREALKDALEKAHYFSEKVCGEIVKLSIQARSYESFINNEAHLKPNTTADEFFAKMKGAKEKIAIRLTNVRHLLQDYLPES